MADSRLTRSDLDQEILNAYWAAQAQFGPFEVGPDEFLRLQQQKQGRVSTEAGRALAIWKSLAPRGENG